MRSLLVLLALGVLVVAGCGDASETSTPTGTGLTTTGTKPAGGCGRVDTPAAGEDGSAEAPTERLDPERTYTLEFRTSCGSFTVTLDQAQSPKAAASLVSLARSGFFDGTIFHRVVPGFVIQGGDPTQRGAGGPGYSTRDTPPADARYVKGVVAMAKSQAEPAGTAGSQFFVVTGADVGLPPDYAIVGTVTKGIGVVERIGELGDPATEAPTQTVAITKVTVAEQP